MARLESMILWAYYWADNFGPVFQAWLYWPAVAGFHLIPNCSLLAFISTKLNRRKTYYARPCQSDSIQSSPFHADLDRASVAFIGGSAAATSPPPVPPLSILLFPLLAIIFLTMDPVVFHSVSLVNETCPLRKIKLPLGQRIEEESRTQIYR